MSPLRGELRHRLMLRVDDLQQPQRVLLTKALALAETIHEGQYRKPSKLDPERKDPYIVHPMRVALILFEELGIKDHESICAALLHDVVEDSNGRVTTNDLERRFGRIIALMVSVLTKPAPDKKISREEQLKTYHERIAQAAIPTRLVKLCDRLDNMRECVMCNDPKFQSRYLEETRAEYLPVAEATDAYLHAELTGLCEQLETILSTSDK